MPPFQDPAWWRDNGPALAGGLLSGLLLLFVKLAAPRPWPAGLLGAALAEAAAAWIAGFLCAVYVGPAIAQLLHVTGPELVGGLKVIVGVMAWKSLPAVRDEFEKAAAALLQRKMEKL
jgi:hypothetical protein